MVTPDPIVELQRLIRSAGARNEAVPDAPADREGTWWLDAVVDDRARQISWSAAQGFGVYDGELGYGDRPARIVASAKEAMAALIESPGAGTEDRSAPRPILSKAR